MFLATKLAKPSVFCENAAECGTTLADGSLDRGNERQFLQKSGPLSAERAHVHQTASRSVAGGEPVAEEICGHGRGPGV
ncbi:unnamed protein product [Bursaphelenchus xylophilus]|uniref:(pine wood nematode) hypothetical protein n=1 Tax=Bursaphelenchus xylophilus TaxID=6326 RepID=A0A1I7RTT4_BURXY|nr:unnamed protein product [Bursaphelenchus xylophilus]CAG9122136.1 unnamed protein product [Bursaphelenchus xylophilus]